MNPHGPSREILVLMTRFPEAGRTKTRLIPALGPAGAAAVQREMTVHATRTLLLCARSKRRRFEIRFEGGSTRAMRDWLGHGAALIPQCAGDLGERLGAVFTDGFQRGATSVIVVGADCPELTVSHIESAFTALQRAPLVLGPAADGGYYLIGLNQPAPAIFAGIPWGTDQVLAKSVAAAGRLGLRVELLPVLSDVDEAADLPRWDHVRAFQRKLSIIIPTLNEASGIQATLESTLSADPCEVIVSDGGSVDGTPELAARFGSKVISGPPGRARQMNAGAAAARGGILLFLHADTWLPAGFSELIRTALEPPDVAGGAFGFRVRETFAGKSIVEWTTNLRSRWWQMPYGDQAIFVRREAFESLGGFEPLPLMEDYSFVRRLRRLGRIRIVGERIQTSGRRWQRLGFWRTTILNKVLIAGFRLGVSPSRLAAIYRQSKFK